MLNMHKETNYVLLSHNTYTHVFKLYMF